MIQPLKEEPAAESDPARGDRLWQLWYIWAIVLLAAVMAAPRLGYLLPALADHRDEIYQPLRALKFAASGGQALHKYGPTPNFVLLPVYAATLGYWKLTGDFSSPSDDYPHGLARPVEQLGVLVLESRLVFFLLGLAALAATAASMRQLTGSRVASAASAALMIATCYRFQWALPSASVDSSMMAFLMLALAAWLWMARDGPTPRRAALFAVASALAVGSKENAGIPLGVMAVALVAWCMLRRRHDEGFTTSRRLWRSVAVAALVGIGLYLVMNVVYAPGVWWQRMQYWSGPGVSGGVWGENQSWMLHLRFVGAGLLNNLGPAGVVVAPLAALAAWLSRPGWAALLSAGPAATLVSVLTLPYSTDRFITPAVVTMAPLVALGITAAWQKAAAPGRGVIAAVLVGAVAINLLWSSVVYHLDDLTEQALMERDLETQPPDRLIGYGVWIGDSPSMHRLRHLGYRADLRAMPEWAAARDELPDVIYTAAGRVEMMEQARDMPERAAFYESEYGFDLDTWPGYEGLGYGPPRSLQVPWPRRLALLEWMPLVRELRHKTMLVYENPAAASAIRGRERS